MFKGVKQIGDTEDVKKNPPKSLRRINKNFKKTSTR